MSIKTLKDWNAQVGDVFTPDSGGNYEVLADRHLKRLSDGHEFNYRPFWETTTFKVVSRANIKYGDWQVGLQVTAPEDAEIKPLGDGWVAYRLPIKPVVVTKEYWLGPSEVAKGKLDLFGSPMYCDPVAKISLNIVDGVPDCDSVKMTKL